MTALKEEKAVEEKAVEGIQPIMAETTPQKLNASLEKESAEATLQETSPEAPLEIPSVSKRKQVNYEKFIGENLFGKIGILVFVIGVGFFVKYAIDKDWINETLRTVLGFLTGSALLVVAAHSVPCLRVAPLPFSISRSPLPFIFITFSLRRSPLLF